MERDTRDKRLAAALAFAATIMAILWTGQAGAVDLPALPAQVEAACLPADAESLPGQMLVDDDAGWSSMASDDLHFGFTGKVCWARWQMAPLAVDDDNRWVLVVDDPMLAEVAVYQQSGDQPFTTQVAGTDQPWSSRPLPSMRPAFPLALSPDHPTTIMIRAHSPNSLRMPLELTTEQQLVEREQRQLLLQTGFIGAMLVMVVWHSVLFMSLRQRAHLLYLGWLVSASLFALTLNGFTQRMLWPDWPLISGHIMLLLLPLMITFPARFSSDFLHLPERAPEAAKRLDQLAKGGIALLIMAAFLSRFIMIPLVAIGAVLTVSVAAWTAWKRVQDGDPDARAFLAGWAVLMAGGLTLGASRFGLVAPNEFADNLFQVGLFLQVSLLALTMAAHIRGLDSARLEAEHATREAESLRQHAINEARSRFLATVSHQFRAPMNGVLGMAELLRRSKSLDQQSKQQADTIYQSASALMITLNDLLDYSSIQAGEVQLDIRPVALDDLLSDVIDLFGTAISRKKVTLNCFIESRVPRMVETDPMRLKQILINLLSNSIKHTDQGEISINISMRDQHPDGHISLLAEVSDSGEGIDPDTLAAIRSGQFREKQGGMGLEVTSELSKLLGGELAINSSPGQGTQVTFTLRCQLGTEETPPLSHRVLIITEQLRTRLSIGQLVRLWGGDARECELTEAEHRLAGDWAPHAIILDQPSFLALSSLPSTHPLNALPKIILEQAETGHQPQAGDTQTFIPLPLRPRKLRDALKGIPQTDSKAPTSEPTPERFRSGIEKLQVLAVDDDQVTQIVIESLLRSLSVSVEMCGSGEDALARIDAHPDRYQVIFMDCEMPGMNGLDAVSALRHRERGRTEPASWIVALTAHTDAETEARARSSGVNDFLGKPVSRQQLKEALGRAAKGLQCATEGV